MPKILIICDSLNNGGAERQMVLLSRGLPIGWERRVWSLDGGPYLQVLQEAGIEVDVSKRKWRMDVSPALDIWRKVYYWRPDIIHAWGWMSALAAVPICRALRIPLVNGSIRSGGRPVRRSSAEMLTLKLAGGVIANSQAGLTAREISPLKGVVIYNGFDMERLKLCTQNVEPSTDCFTAIMAGRMNPQKDFRSFIQAAHEMSKLGMRAHFMAVGNGIMKPELIKEGEDLINKGYLSFPEAGMEIIPFLNRANVGVLMTNQLIHTEGISNAIMEYMACGLPVICNNSGGNHEIVIENETGFIISFGDVQQLVEKLIFLYENPVISKKMGQAGHNRLLYKFTGEKMVENMVSYYQSIINLRKNKKNGLMK
jgi:glycosyltransferase involved in cell wall biosynthesis